MLLDALATKIFLPTWDRVRGSEAARYRAEVRKVLNADADQIRKFQLQRIRHICRHAYEKTDFYRKRFDEVGIDSFDHLSWDEFLTVPILTKTDLRVRASSLLSTF